MFIELCVDIRIRLTAQQSTYLMGQLSFFSGNLNMMELINYE